MRGQAANGQNQGIIAQDLAGASTENLGIRKSLSQCWDKATRQEFRSYYIFTKASLGRHLKGCTRDD